MSTINSYAGIGSRKTPKDVLLVMAGLAALLDRRNYVLRSGGAPGADQAFFAGVPVGRRHRAEIYLPASVFCGQYSSHPGFIDARRLPAWAAALATVDRYHPNPEALGPTARALMARNAMQVLGAGLDDPVRFVVAWTPGGQVCGGTGQALRIAADHGIEVRNLGNPETLQKAIAFINQ